MKTNDVAFWQKLRKLTATDQSVTVPDETLQRALAIFQPQVQPERGSIFGLRTAFAGMVRRAQPTANLWYQLGENMLQLEKTRDEDGFHLSGFAHGLEEGTVTLYGGDYVDQTPLEAGQFEFSAVPPGTYNLSFTVAAEDFWLTNLELAGATTA